MGDLVGDRAVVLGGSMGGMLAARVLSEVFREVLLIDREELTGVTGYRRGVPHGRHAHALLARGHQIMEAQFPGLTDDLTAAGTVPGDANGDIRWYFNGQRLRSARSGLMCVPATRPVLEFHVRERARAIANVSFLERCDILGLETTPDAGRVTGARIRREDGSEEVVSADLVIDTTGRGSRTPAWLEEMGYDRPEEERIKIGLAYTTRHYDLPADPFGDELAIIPVATPEHPRGGILYRLPASRSRVELSLIGIRGDHAPTDPDGFHAFARSLPIPDLYNAVRDAEPLDDAVTFQFPASVWRHYERLTRFPGGLLVMGDAVCSFNPVYGQGMTVASLESLTLRKHLANGPRPDARRYFADVARDIADPWDVSAGADLAYPGVEGNRTPKLRIANAYVGKLQKAAVHDSELTNAFIRVAGLVDRPMALMKPRTALRVLRRSLFPSTPEPNGSPVTETERQPHASLPNRDSAG
ncbi:FAD-dependent monooxygenase [Actinomadura sp. DC4]|uniref:FAD-dependent oxidoreductase n=1 Tax=Actinomadura sp. DC4 TaxID=3055069 RepID=UPI0025B1952A|nr:FAD-dependent monooxygenase [Actinomadura sp. DC4]MDN3354707.1 FAD-dependent monooxygenase [Actinomadura sp. DC4]